MENKSPLERAWEFIGQFKSEEIEGSIDDGKKIISNFPHTCTLFAITLPSDFVEKSKINQVTLHYGFRFRLDILYYYIFIKREILDRESYRDLLSFYPDPPRSMNEGGKTKRWLEREGREVPCGICDCSGYVICSICGGMGKINCGNCGGTGEQFCPSCAGHGTYGDYDGRGQYHQVTCSTCGGSGQEICCDCGGSRYEPCGYCAGSGNTVCSNCVGYGILMDSDVWHMKSWVVSEVHRLSSGIFDSYIDKFKGNNSYEKYFDNDHLSMIPNDTEIISRCEVRGVGFKVWKIYYSYEGKTHILFKEDGGEFHWKNYPKDWKKIGIFIMILLAILFFIFLFIFFID